MFVAIVCLLFCLPLIFLSAASMDGHLRPKSPFRTSRMIGFCELGAAWFLGLMFVCGGMSKLMPFPGLMGPVWLEEQLAQYELGLFARFIAWSEAVIGLLLLSKQTRVLGSIMMVPLLFNILMVTISMNWQGTPWVILFFLCINLFLLAYHYPHWRPAVDVAVDFLILKSRVSPRYPWWMCLLSMILILSGPILFKLSTSMAVVVILVGFGGLVWSEAGSRYRLNRSRGMTNAQEGGASHPAQLPLD